MKFNLLKWVIIFSICFGFNSVFAQQLKEHLFVYDSHNNSYKTVVQNKPYAIFLNDTLILKGYFDAVYPKEFLFATKDSVYVLSPEQILNVIPIGGFDDNAINTTSKVGNSFLKAGGVILITLGAITLPGAVIALITEPASGAVISVFSASMITGGIIMASTANKNTKQTESAYTILNLQNDNRYKLRIIKSPL